MFFNNKVTHTSSNNSITALLLITVNTDKVTMSVVEIFAPPAGDDNCTGVWLLVTEVTTETELLLPLVFTVW